MGLYFSLDTKLPKGGNLVLDFGFTAHIAGSCDVHPIGTTLDVTKYTAKTAGRIAGTTADGKVCVLAADLAANTAYAMILPDKTGPSEVAGVFGPIGMTTWTYTATNGVMLD